MSYTKVGIIVNTHGLNGTVKVKSFTDFKDERYKRGNQLFIEVKNQKLPVTVTKFRTVKTVEYIDFDEFTNINEVEKYKGCDLYISDELIHELDENEFYFGELVGMEVYMDELIGVVKEVLDMPKGEMLLVKRENNKDAMIPFHKEFIKDVDKEQKKITIIHWEGLL